ncbi:glutathione S-transferase C-terminal-like protein [Lentinus brumalis]|uniref:glutathione transferase n=1 Tax=Lentinus brumalis TaxID=2498619 RepID=A0A371CL45_9APHY|nr:glutathione S-transferase C-terminal-like protein [Polyporus brumalis]
MVLKLYGLAVATCTKRVRVVLEELQVPYELVAIDILKADHKKDEIKEHQPFGQIPWIDDDGFKLFESRAICRYIALKYGGIGKLIPDPADVQKTALFEQAASIETSNFDPPVWGLAHEKVFEPFFGRAPNPQNVEAHEKALEGRLSGYEALLSKTKYVAGDELTLIDLFHLSYGALLKVQGYDYLESEKYPNVARWWKDVSSRPTWVKVNSVQLEPKA